MRIGLTSNCSWYRFRFLFWNIEGKIEMKFMQNKTLKKLQKPPIKIYCDSFLSICKFHFLKASPTSLTKCETFSLIYRERSNHNHYNSLQSRWKMSLEHHFASFFSSRCCLRLHLSRVSFHPSIHCYHFLQSNGYSRISLLLRRFSRRMNGWF